MGRDTGVGGSICAKPIAPVILSDRRRVGVSLAGVPFADETSAFQSLFSGEGTCAQ